MDVILDYICEEIEEIEQKVRKDGKLSMTEIEYLDKLEHIKKDMLTSEAMMNGGYSNEGSYGYESNYGGGSNESYNSYARGGRGGGRGGHSRNSMERYSGRRYSREEGMSYLSQEIEKLMNEAQNQEEREVLKQAHQKLKNMM